MKRFVLLLVSLLALAAQADYLGTYQMGDSLAVSAQTAGLASAAQEQEPNGYCRNGPPFHLDLSGLGWLVLGALGLLIVACVRESCRKGPSDSLGETALAIFLVLAAVWGVTRADYLGSWAINDYLVIKANTHRLSSGAAYGASSITYRIYEDANSAEIVSDTSMDEFDSVTGFYLEQVQLTPAAGFEAGKCYTVLIQATVDGVSATKSDTFQIGLNAGKLAGNDLPTHADNVFDDLIEAAGEGSVLNLDASGNVTLADGTLTANKYDASTAWPLGGDVWTLLFGMVEADGAVYRWTENALEEGPSGTATLDANDFFRAKWQIAGVRDPNCTPDTWGGLLFNLRDAGW